MFELERMIDEGDGAITEAEALACINWSGWKAKILGSKSPSHS